MFAVGTGEQKWRMPVTMSLTALGVILLIVGVAGLLIDGSSKFITAVVVGVPLVFYFGPLAAGARQSKIGTGLVKSETDFSAPPPPRSQRRSYLPKGRGSSSKRK